MVMLAMDTCFDACSVAVCDFTTLGGIMIRAAERLPMATGHAEALPAMVTRVLAAWNKRGPDITAIAVTHGPGTFAGTRIGVAMARGLAVALGKPAVGVSSLHAIAAPVVTQLDREGRSGFWVVTAVDARRGELYVQTVGEDHRPVAPPALVAPPSAAAGLPAGPVVLVGSGSAALLAAATAAGRSDVTIADADPLPDARAVAFLAANVAGLMLGQPEPLRPLYLRAADVTLPRAHGSPA